MNWFGNLAMDIGSSGRGDGYFGKVESMFDTSEKAFCNFSKLCHSWGRRFGSDGMEFGKL